MVLRAPTKGTYAEMSAAGTTQTDAAEITADYVLVTTVAAGSGVLLPAGNLSDEVVIVNGHATESLLIYPRSGGKLNNATADAALTLPANSAAHFIGINDKNWAAFF